MSLLILIIIEFHTGRLPRRLLRLHVTFFLLRHFFRFRAGSAIFTPA